MQRKRSKQREDEERARTKPTTEDTEETEATEQEQDRNHKGHEGTLRNGNCRIKHLIFRFPAAERGWTHNDVVSPVRILCHSDICECRIRRIVCGIRQLLVSHPVIER